MSWPILLYRLHTYCLKHRASSFFQSSFHPKMSCLSASAPEGRAPFDVSHIHPDLVAHHTSPLVRKDPFLPLLGNSTKWRLWAGVGGSPTQQQQQKHKHRSYSFCNIISYLHLCLLNPLFFSDANPRLTQLIFIDILCSVFQSSPTHILGVPHNPSASIF